MTKRHDVVSVKPIEGEVWKIGHVVRMAFRNHPPVVPEKPLSERSLVAQGQELIELHYCECFVVDFTQTYEYILMGI